MLVCTLNFYAVASAAESSQAVDEARLRAAVIVGIMRFTSWPEAHPYLQADTVNVCLVGHPIAGHQLLPVSGIQKAAGKPLHIEERISTSVESCHVVVVGSRLSRRRFDSLMERAGANSMLTVCDGCREESADETIIQLTLHEQKVNFSVNLVQAKQTNVLLDARLLELAEQVRK